MKKIVCLYGGPGTGKSTTCAGVFYKLKMMGVNAEMNREYIKEWVWEGRKIQSGDQPYFFSKQARRERLYMAKDIDIIITDSPLVLTHYYGTKYDPFEQKSNTSLMMLQHHHEVCKELGYKTDHFFLTRTKPYNSAGRYQNEEQAKKIDEEILGMLTNLNIKHDILPADDGAVDAIVKKLLG